jgi:hypothetical protein
MSTDQQLCAAAKAGNHAAAERLLESDDADPNAKDQHGGNPALSFAVAGGHTEVAALLIVRRADVAAAGEHGAPHRVAEGLYSGGGAAPTAQHAA